MAVRRIIASGLVAAGSFAAQHRKFVTGVGLGSGGAVVFNAARDAAAQFILVVERHGDAFLDRQTRHLDAFADMLSNFCAALFSASVAAATGVAALALCGLLVPYRGSRGMLTVCLCNNEQQTQLYFRVAWLQGTLH